MKGARKYCEVFKKAEQIGRLYILPGSHARGRTLSVYVLPAGEKVVENAGINPPLNNDAVEVYGIISGHPGWTEAYGWLYQGPWQQDFEKIFADRRLALDIQKQKASLDDIEATEAKEKRKLALLSDY